MKLNRHSISTGNAERGVALVMTLILLAVITFLAVAFLVLSQRERGSTTEATEQTTARLAADAALERAKAELLARILGATNIYLADLMVATNYQNAYGFDSLLGLSGTNVNFDRKADGSPWTLAERQQHLANLLYDPRVPVFVTNRYFANSNDFRYYLDLNRNGRYDTNGLRPLIVEDNSGIPGPPGFYYVRTNGSLLSYDPLTPPASTEILVSNYFVGDPEWRGILSRPDEFHGPNNRFISRDTFLVVPAGQTLDINYIHNHAKRRVNATAEGFLRNQGVGSWEINLAAFLADLNTNLWLRPPADGGYALNMAPPYYQYYTNDDKLNTGAAFDDANRLLAYRYVGTVNNYDAAPLAAQATVFGLYGGVGEQAFWSDGIDSYSGGPIMTDYRGLAYQGVVVDPDTPRTKQTWPGGYFRQRFFTGQDLFSPKINAAVNGYDFGKRLRIAGTNTSSYDRYTFYRMLAQLGTDSAPEPAWKVNLNFANVAGLSATNFVDWSDPDLISGNSSRGIPATGASGALLFFTNAAEKLLMQYTKEWRGANLPTFQRDYGMNQAFGVSGIPVLISNRFVYTPSVHRLLQLSANIYDASTNRTFASSTNQFPSVFRPYFRKQANGPYTDVYVAGYTEVGAIAGGSNPVGSDPQFLTPRDLNNAADIAALQPADNIYGVPWVIGAKKGLPNFNEFAMQSLVQITRKLQVVRPSVTAPRSTWKTNMLYVVGVSNVVGLEAWNSYQTTYGRALSLIVQDDVTMSLTNSFGFTRTVTTNLVQALFVPAQTWLGYRPGLTDPKFSFRVPLRTNLLYQLDLGYDFPNRRFVNSNLWEQAWDTSQSFQMPQWGWGITNRLRFIILDAVERRVLDYVQLGGPDNYTDLSYEMQKPLPNRTGSFADMWGTNLINGIPAGINNQMLVSSDHGNDFSTDWSNYGIGTPPGPARSYEIDYYRALYRPDVTPNDPNLNNTNLVQQVPYSPTVRISLPITWQANDPLVHYTAGDLQNLALAVTNAMSFPALAESVPLLKNLTNKNERYQPWGEAPSSAGDVGPFSLTVKDSLMTSSDGWAFPTNKFPNIGWLGRVHRGTPWQTIYMKAPDINTNVVASRPNDWQGWSGNANYDDAMRMRPVSDRLLFDVFTTAIGENGTRGQLSINQPGLAAWSGVFSGLIALTNTTTDAILNLRRPPVYAMHDPALLNFSYGVQPVGLDGTNAPLYRIWKGINDTRAKFAGGSFRYLGDILAVPQLTTNSPFLNTYTVPQLQNGINDAVYEWLPQQIMGLLRVGEPRFVVYSYGQTLKPAERGILAGGQYDGMVTNYQPVAEVTTRAVLRVEGSPVPGDPSYPPRIVVESFNLLPAD